MNNNETQLLNSVLAIAALSANISPEELKEYVNALSVDSSKVRSDDRFSDADILRSAVGLLRVYRDETIAKMVPAEVFNAFVCPTVCLHYSDALTRHDRA